MNIIMHINISAFPIVILAAIYFTMRKSAIQTTDNRLFCRLVGFTELLLLSELISWSADGWPFPFARSLNWAANLCYFLLVPFAAMLWMRYVYYHVSAKEPPRFCDRRSLFVTAPLAVYDAMVILTPWTRWVFYIDGQNLYARGAFFYLSNALCIYYMLLAIGYSLQSAASRHRQYQKRQILAFALFSAIPIAAGVAQAFAAGIWIVLPSTAIAEMMSYIHLQRQLIKKDALTGVNNRGSLDDYLRRAGRGKKTGLCVYMVDLDHLKQINDTYGHEVGDAALIRAADALKRFVRGSDAFLARYGGDEFCVVKRCASDEEAGETARRIRESFCIADGPDGGYALSCGVGYCFCEDARALHPDQMIRQADEMLYAFKKKRGCA